MKDSKAFWLTTLEVAKILKVNQDTLYRYINRENNPLPCYKISSSNILIKQEELEFWIKKQKNGGIK